MLEDSLEGLLNCEEKIEEIERKLEIQRLRECQSIYAQRREFIAQVDKFWYIVLSQHQDFGDFLNVKDYMYFENLKDLYVEYDTESPGSFTLTLHFGEIENELEEQKISKKFSETRNEENDEISLHSEPCGFKWPKSLTQISDKLKKKNFFQFFNWTGDSEDDTGFEGEQLARMFSEDIFPNAVKYYTETHRDELEEELKDDEESEPELDTS